ncbi:MAG: hypothetical protein RBR99_01730 [Dehalococcoidales bacterium]|nr:hypothetical protein [Dehalococcoidales bacterium]MDX9986167.1 hypothetical protein [Dehalococcoidales bacterium]NLE90294.1 hypothetical protein [Dehalococcoidales bacterium]
MRHSNLRFLLLFCLSFVMVLTIGCGKEVSFTTAKLSEATMATGVTGDFKPQDPTTTFYANTAEIFCSVKLSNAPADTTVTGIWIYENGQEQHLTNYEIDRYSITTDGTRYLMFSLTRPNTGFPIGNYKLVLTIDEKEPETLKFKVVSLESTSQTKPATTPVTSHAPTITTAISNPARLTEATMANAVTDDNKPIGPNTVFEYNAEAIFCSVKLVDAPAGTSINSSWIYIEGELDGVTNYEIDSAEITVDGPQYLSFLLSKPDVGFPAGEYKLVLSIDGQVAASLPFEVIKVRDELGPNLYYVINITEGEELIVFTYWKAGEKARIDLDIESPDGFEELTIIYDSGFAYLLVPMETIVPKVRANDESADFTAITSLLTKFYLHSFSEQDALIELGELCADDGSCTGVTIDGHDVIHDITHERACTVFKFSYTDGSSTYVWIELETGLVWRMESYAGDVVTIFEWIGISLNPVVTPDTVLFDLPEWVEIVDMTGE